MEVWLDGVRSNLSECSGLCLFAIDARLARELHLTTNIDQSLFYDVEYAHARSFDAFASHAANGNSYFAYLVEEA